MITYNNIEMGIKESGNDIKKLIKPIIMNAEQFLLLGTYNFTNSFIYYDLGRNTTAIKGIILPNIITRYDGNISTINDITTILSDLVNIGVTVIIDANNHSKFIISEKDMYFGSANLTATSMRYKCEVISIFRDKDNNFYNDLRSDFSRIFYQKLSDPTFNGIISNNAHSIRQLEVIRNHVLKLNPNATKVKKTIDNYELCISIINDIINDYFKLLSFEDFARVYIRLEKVKLKLKNLVDYGYYEIIKIAEKNERLNDLHEFSISNSKINGYNKRYYEFLKKLNDIITYIEEKGEKFKSYEIDKVAYKNKVSKEKLKKSLSEYFNI